MADGFCAGMASTSRGPCEASILEARNHDQLVVEELYDAVTDDDESNVAAYSTGNGGASGSADGAESAERGAEPAPDLALDAGLAEFAGHDEQLEPPEAL